MTTDTEYRRPTASMKRLLQVANCKDQLKALESLGYVSSWNHESKNSNHYFTINMANGGVYLRLTLANTRLLLAGLLAGAQGRETSVHLTQYDWGVLCTAIAKERMLQQDLGESYSDDITESCDRLYGHFQTQRGFE